MKILSISTIPLLPHLGSGKTRLHWTEGLKKLGHIVDVLEPKDFEPLKRLKKAKSYRMAAGILFTVKKLLKNESYDIIEFYGDEYWLLLLWFKKMKKKRPLLVAHADAVELNDMDKAQVFWHTRKGFNKWLFNNTHYRFSKITFSLADRLVCGSTDDLKYVIEKRLFSVQHAVCIPPGIEDSFHNLAFEDKKDDVISYIGSWIGRKGISIIPVVINKVLKDNPNFSFHIFGAGETPETVLQNFDSAVKKRVIVFNKMSLAELQQNLRPSSICFMPSYSEGFGLAVVEAMSCSCAVVTTPTGIGKDLINNGEAMICNFDDTESMIRSINFLIQNIHERKELAYKGWLRSKEYVWQKQVKKLEATYLHWCSNSA